MFNGVFRNSMGPQRVKKKKKRHKMASTKSTDVCDIEQDLIENTIKPSGNATKCAIITLADLTVRANFPDDFLPPKQCLEDIVAAYGGDTAGVAERGINYEQGIPVNVPAKIYEKRMFGNDGQGGGSVIYKTKSCLLIVVYKKNPAPANRMTTKAGEYLEKNGL